MEKGILVHPEELTLSWLDRMKDAGLNLLGLHPVGGRKAHLSLQEAVERHREPGFRRLLDEAGKRGITVEYEAHAMRWLLPEAEFSRHPDWFRMDEQGTRVPDFNLCASNPSALDFVAARTALLARKLQTGSHRYFYWLDDVTGCRCHCAGCAALSASDQQMKVLNAMLTGLRSVDPEASLCYLAYHDALQPPQLVSPRDGIFPEFAPINRNHHRPIADGSCPENAALAALLPPLLSRFGTKNARVLEYWMDNSMFSGWKKPPKPFTLDSAVMKEDAAFYRGLGFETITSFGCYLGPDYQALYGLPPLKEYGNNLR